MSKFVPYDLKMVSKYEEMSGGSMVFFILDARFPSHKIILDSDYSGSVKKLWQFLKPISTKVV